MKTNFLSARHSNSSYGECTVGSPITVDDSLTGLGFLEVTSSPFCCGFGGGSEHRMNLFCSQFDSVSLDPSL